MTLNEFINKYNGKKLDFDGAYGAQCKDLFSAYNKEVIGNPNYIVGDAYKLFDAAPASVYDKIKNTPTGVPQPGDIIIWDQGIGKYGHVAVFVEGDARTFRSFDQNFPLNSACHIQNHDYKAVIGWLRKKAVAPPPPPPPPPDPCASVKAELENYKELLRGANGTILNLEAQLKELVENPKIIKETVTVEVPVAKVEVRNVEVEPKWLSAIRNYITSYLGRKK